MSHKYKISRQYRKLFKRYAEENLREDVSAILNNADMLYDGFKKETPDIGGKKNLMSVNLDMALAFFAFYEASGKCLKGSDILMMAEWMTEGMKPLGKFIDFNKPWVAKLMYKFYSGYSKKANRNKDNGTWNNTWGVEINPEGQVEGCAFYLVGCPLVDFAKKHGYMEIMPYLCETDHVTANLMNAKLIRKHTVAQGSEFCDYWYVGNKSETAKDMKK